MVTPQQAEAQIERGFFIHLGVYVPVVAGLIALNMTRHPERVWSWWVAGGWGAGVALHAILVYLTPHKRALEQTMHRMRQREERRAHTR